MAANLKNSQRAFHVPGPTTYKGDKPVAAKTPFEKPRWCFSFEYWRQPEHFGLSGKSVSWFVSLLERLRQISGEFCDVFDKDLGKRNSYHYHEVNWQQPGIPIQRADMYWLPRDYLDNEAEYPFYQFSISSGLGRVAGFWDEANRFNIVLLDPHHNLQPVKDYDYQVTANSAMPNEHELLLAKLGLIQDSSVSCNSERCETIKALRALNLNFQPYGIVYVDREYYLKALEFLNDGTFNSVREILELGILCKADSAESSNPPIA